MSMCGISSGRASMSVGARECGEDGGVLGADHPAPNPRRVWERSASGGWCPSRATRSSSNGTSGRWGRDPVAKEERRREAAGATSRERYLHGMRVDKAARAVDQLDLVPLEIGGDGPLLGLDDVLQPVQQVVHAHLMGELALDAVEAAGTRARKVEGGPAQRLGGQRAGVDTSAADGARALDQRDALAEVRHLRGALLTGGAGAITPTQDRSARFSHSFVRSRCPDVVR